MGQQGLRCGWLHFTRHSAVYAALGINGIRLQAGLYNMAHRFMKYKSFLGIRHLLRHKYTAIYLLIRCMKLWRGFK